MASAQSLPGSRPDVIHVSPHPDDEAVGCPATLLALARSGLSVTNLVTSLGAPSDRERRRSEVTVAGAIGGFDVEVLDHLIGTDRPTYAAGVTAAIVESSSRRLGPVLLVSPSPHDKHPRHEAVGRATAAAAKSLGQQAIWWMYAVWGTLPLPTACYPFDDDAEREAERLLSAYEGELARNDYRRLIRGRAAAAAVLGAEQIFGFGSFNDFTEPYMELFTETGHRGGKWLAGEARRINAEVPLADLSTRDLTEWITAPSPGTIVGW